MIIRLKKLRLEHNITQKKLAEHIGVSQQSINKYENHNIEPDIETLCRIATYFNVPVDYLIGHSDSSVLCDTCVKKSDLDNDELKLIQSYKLLNENQKQSIQMVIYNYLNY